VTEAERKAEGHYYETLDLAQLVGKAGDAPHELLMECADALANLRTSLEEFYMKPAKEKLN
jgi:hypothetical protein